MRLLRTKNEPERLLDNVGDSLAALTDGMRRSTMIKAGLIAGGVAALTAGSAAISSLRRRMGESDS
jgi:hypothetical protein